MTKKHIDSAFLRNILNILDATQAEAARAIGIFPGTLSRWCDTSRRSRDSVNAKPSNKNINKLIAGLTHLAEMTDAPYLFTAEMIECAPEYDRPISVFEHFIRSTSHPFVDGFFWKMANLLRTASMQKEAEKITHSAIEPQRKALEKITPQYWQKKFIGGSYLIDAAGAVGCAYTPLDPKKPQLRGELVGDRDYFAPAMGLAPTAIAHVSDVIYSIDRGGIPIVVVAANVYRGVDEILGVIDAVIDVNESPLHKSLTALAARLRRALSAESDHPVSITVYDRVDNVIAHLVSPETKRTWLREVESMWSDIPGKARCQSPLFCHSPEAMYASSALDSVPGFVVSVCTAMPIQRS